MYLKLTLSTSWSTTIYNKPKEGSIIDMCDQSKQLINLAVSGRTNSSVFQRNSSSTEFRQRIRLKCCCLHRYLRRMLPWFVIVLVPSTSTVDLLLCLLLTCLFRSLSAPFYLWHLCHAKDMMNIPQIVVMAIHKIIYPVAPSSIHSSLKLPAFPHMTINSQFPSLSLLPPSPPQSLILCWKCTRLSFDQRTTKNRIRPWSSWKLLERVMNGGRWLRG